MDITEGGLPGWLTTDRRASPAEMLEALRHAAAEEADAPDARQMVGRIVETWLLERGFLMRGARTVPLDKLNASNDV